MRRSAWREEARRRIADLVVEAGARGIADPELARHVERACPWPREHRWPRLVWAQERRRLAGRLRRVRADVPKEYAGMLGLSVDTEPIPWKPTRAQDDAY